MGQLYPRASFKCPTQIFLPILTLKALHTPFLFSHNDLNYLFLQNFISFFLLPPSKELWHLMLEKKNMLFLVTSLRKGP